MPKYRAGANAATAPNAWGDAEPYYFGNQMPPKDLFKPLPEGENLFQEGQENGFSENVVLSGYRHNGQPLSYIKKGTFPKAGSAQELGLWGGDWAEGGTTDYKIYCSGNALNIVQGTTVIKALTSEDFPSIGKIPSRLGILLVGGGGGSGGYTWYDPDKNGKSSDQYVVSGSAGGGGALLWGVLHLDTTSTEKYFIVKTGNGGKAGANAGRDGLCHTNPKYGAVGDDGVATLLYWHDTDDTEDQLIATANGGKGGSRGNFQVDAAGGDGGTAVHNLQHSYFTYVGGKKGGKGCDCTPNPIPTAPAWGVTIKFAETEDSRYITTISHEAVSAVMQGGTNDDSQAHKVPGGASYDIGSTSVDGAGGDKTDNDFKTEVYGRGGAGGSWTQINERGAPGCFLLFY